MRVTLLLSVLTAPCVHTERKIPDRAVPVRRFSCGNLYYRKFHLAEDLHSTALYVGAMDNVFKLSAENINRSRCDIGHLKLPAENFEGCAAKNETDDYECRNHIRVIQSIGRDRIYVCGTNAMSPKDWVYKASLKPTGDVPPGIGNGTGRCPFSPYGASTAIWVDIGNPDDLPGLYAGTSTDIDGETSGIFRTPLFSPETANETFSAMRTLNDSKWLDSPGFVGSFDIDEYVYFFFRDGSSDQKKNEADVISYVGRVCKEDTGNRRLEGIFATYSKARLNCSLPGLIPFYFDEIQAVYKSPSDDRMFFASFASPLNNDSAICAFPLEYINDAFNGDYREDGVWSQEFDLLLSYRDPQYRPGTCGYDTQMLPDEVLEFFQFHAYMDSAVRLYGGRPFYQGEDITFVSLVYHREEIVDDEYTILYTGTSDGRIIKVIQGKELSEPPIDEEWDVMDGHAIQTMEISLEQRSLYVSSDAGVAQLTINVCSEPYENLTRKEWYECVLGKEEADRITMVEPTTIHPDGTGKARARSGNDANMAHGIHGYFEISMVLLPLFILLLRDHNVIQ